MAEPQLIRINEIAKFSMFENAPGAEGRRSRLAWSIRDGNPRITVYTNIPTDTVGKGIISAPMNPETFFATLSLLEKAATGANGDKFKIECYTSVYKDNKPTDERTLISEVWVGKDEQGTVWISVTAANRPKIKFEFRISDYHKIYKSDGTQITKSESSILQAMSVIKALNNIYYGLTGAFKLPADSSKTTAGLNQMEKTPFNNLVADDILF